MAKPQTFVRSAPIPAVRDVLKSRVFYCNALRFRTGGVWGEPPCFAIVGRDTITVFLDQAPDGAPIPYNHGWAAYLYVTNVNALAAEFSANGVELIRGPKEADYGCREVDIRDPDGHLIGFSQDLNPGPDGPGL